MRATVEGAGVALAYREAGQGPAVLLVHDMGHDASSWEALTARLAPRARVVAYDRRGYGHSGAPDPYEGTTVYEQSEDAAALIERLRLGPLHVCGAGFGALVGLDLAVRHRRLVRGVVCVAPPLYAFVAEATEILAAEHELLRDTMGDRGPQAAVERWLEGHPGPGAAAASPQAFFADFAGLSTWPVTRAQLRAIGGPVVVVTDVHTPPHLLAAAAALTRLVPGARTVADGNTAGAIEGLLE